MKRFSSIARTVAAILFALFSVFISGSYVTYVLSCDGMQKKEISLNGEKSCCCSDEDQSCDENDSSNIETQGCCNVTANLLAVDTYSFTPVKIGMFPSEKNLFLSASLFLAGLSAPENHTLSQGVYKSPPPEIKPLGRDIVYCISRQLRI